MPKRNGIASSANTPAKIGGGHVPSRVRTRVQRNTCGHREKSLFHYDDYSALEEFDNALQAALATVRLLPEAYPRTGKARRRFTFEYRSVPYAVTFSFDGEVIVLHDLHFARSARTAHWLTE